MITVVHREVHVLRKLRALEAPPALEEPPAAAPADEPLADDLWPEPSGRGDRAY